MLQFLLRLTDESMIQFEQRILDRSDFHVDSESGYSQMKEIEEYDVYYRFTEKYHYYLWSNNKYGFHLTSNRKIKIFPL